MSAVSSLQKVKNGNDRFNAEAASWDSNAGVRDASRKASEAILAHIPKIYKHRPIEKLDILEIGCGTGLLSTLLADHARHYVAVDAAQGMIDVLEGKLERGDVQKNILPLALLLEDPEDKALPAANENDPKGGRLKFDLIVSHLVLHHIPDMRAVLTTMLGCLKDGASVALTDFEDEGPHSKRFHAKSRMEGVQRHGINAVEMEKLMNAVGFVNVKVERVWKMDKRVERWEGEFGDKGRSEDKSQGELVSFPFVLCTGERKYCETSDSRL
jgi:SAM-dependent methyltransferase